MSVDGDPVTCSCPHTEAHNPSVDDNGVEKLDPIIAIVFSTQQRPADCSTPAASPISQHLGHDWLIHIVDLDQEEQIHLVPHLFHTFFRTTRGKVSRREKLHEDANKVPNKKSIL